MLTRRVLAFVPDVVGVGGVLLGGIYWITHRREEVAAAEGERRAPRTEEECLAHQRALHA